MLTKLFISYFFILLSFCSVFALPGSLDTAFGNNGKVIYRTGDRMDSFEAVAVQSDGKIITAGTKSNGNAIVCRYDRNGLLDPSFGVSGVSLPATSDSVFEKIALYDDGRILLVGRENISPGDIGFLLIRLNPNGSLDQTLNGTGFLTSNFTNVDDYIRDVELQPDGKIVVTGVIGSAGDYSGNIAVVRYNSNGTLDNAFGIGGVVTTQFHNAGRPYAVKIQNDGKIVVSAASNTSNLIGNNFVLIRYLPNGALDTAFGIGGRTTITYTGDIVFQFGDLEIDQNNRLVVGGMIGSNSSFIYAVTIYRFLQNGVIDITFGDGGTKIIDTNSAAAVSAVELQQDGKILVAGTSPVSGTGMDILVSRLNYNGTFDKSYGNGGKSYFRITSALTSDYCWDAVLQPDGKLVVVGDYNVSFLDFDAIILRIEGDSSAPRRTAFDYDGDGKADVSVFRTSTASWYVSNSLNNSFFGTNFGISTDVIAPADFDGDGKTDISVYRNGNWYRLNSSDNSFSAYSFGLPTDIPLPADFDGDGKADINVYRPSTGNWYRLNSSNNQFTATTFGTSEDKPQIGDFDGDGKADICVFRPSTGYWYRLNSSNAQFVSINFGSSGDLTVPADYDGDGKTDIAVYRNGNWYRLNSSDNSFNGTAFGNAADKPVAADYDGDGKADIGVFRPTEGNWYLLKSTSGFAAQSFGSNGDIPTPTTFVK